LSANADFLGVGLRFRGSVSDGSFRMRAELALQDINVLGFGLLSGHLEFVLDSSTTSGQDDRITLGIGALLSFQMAPWAILASFPLPNLEAALRVTASRTHVQLRFRFGTTDVCIQLNENLLPSRCDDRPSTDLLLLGDECSLGSECASERCDTADSTICGSWLTSWGCGTFCQPKIRDNAACNEDSDCDIGNCFETLSDGGLCRRFASLDEACVVPEDCEDTLTCYGGSPGVGVGGIGRSEGRCKQSCDSDSQCASVIGLHFCAESLCRECASNSHCTAGNQFCETYKCETKRGNGDACDEDADCLSNICHSSCGFLGCPDLCRECGSDSHCASGSRCEEYQCVAKLGSGEECEEDADCLSDSCTCDGGFLLCDYRCSAP